MLRFILGLFIITASYSAVHSQTKNPVFDGWYADPEAVIFDRELWIYPTYSNRYEKQVFLDAFSSADGINWTKHHRIIDTAEVKWAHKAIWAPAIIKKDSLYYLFFSANDVHEGEVGGIGVAVSKDPAGPFKDLLGKPLIGIIQNGAQPIDQYVFKYQNSYYMIYGGWGHCNMVRLKDDFSAIIPLEDETVFKEITPQGYVEGPTLFERNGKWYFMWSEGGWGGPDYRVAYATGDSPFGPFKKIGTVLQQDEKIATGAGHHSIVKLPGDRWMIIYHRRPLGDKARDHRVVCIDWMFFDENGLIKSVKITNAGAGAFKLE
jgi:beta-xylosidase